MKHLKKIIAIIVTVLIMGLILYRFFGKQEEPAAYEIRPTVSVEYPVNGDIIIYTELIGSVEPQSKITVMPKMRGEILELYIQAGDYVEAGQELCRIHSDALESLRINLDAAQVSLNDANNNLSRMQVLYQAGDIPKQTLEQIQSGATNARLAYEAAKNQYDLHQEYMTITAPISGVIESRNVNVHDNLEVGTAVCTISAQDQFQVDFGVTEKTLKHLTAGDEVKAEKNGTEYTATVTEISTAVNSATGLYDVKAVLPQGAGLTGGSKVKLTVVMEESSDVLTIPVDAVSYDGGKPFVYCYEDGIAVKTEIEAGIYDSEALEVKAGLTGESRIITSWSNELVNGAEVIEAAAQKH